MAQRKYINIQFPFRDDPEGKFLELNTEPKRAIKADLIHLLLTNTGERLYMPDFGANLRKYLFEMNDAITQEAIKNEIATAVKKFIPNLIIKELTAETDPSEERAVLIRIDYVVTIAAFQETDFIILKL